MSVLCVCACVCVCVSECVCVMSLSYDTHSSFSSSQLGSSRSEERCFTPESSALLPFSHSFLMCEGFDLSFDARELKPSSVILQSVRLQTEQAFFAPFSTQH